MTHEPTLEQVAQDTARDILTRHAPDCLHRHELREAIARLARLGLESCVRLYQTQERPRAE